MIAVKVLHPICHCIVKHLGVLPPPLCDVISSEGYPSIFSPYPFMYLNRESQCGKVGKAAHEPRRPQRKELNLVSVQHEATESIDTPPWMGC